MLDRIVGGKHDKSDAGPAADHLRGGEGEMLDQREAIISCGFGGGGHVLCRWAVS